VPDPDRPFAPGDCGPVRAGGTGADAQDHRPREACGVFAIWAPGEAVANLAFYGLWALQHRGQESAGMAVADGRSILVYREMGLVSQVFDEATLATLSGHLAIGHTRYSTTGASCWENAQPFYKDRRGGRGLAVAHNGNLTNTTELADRAGGRRDASDTELLAELLAAEERPLEDAIAAVMPLLRGAYSLVLMDERTVYGVRDPHGVRPLCLGRLPGGPPGGRWVIASETAALDIVGASLVREVAPGELLAIDEGGVRSRRFAPASPHLCVFEHVYLARADSTVGGRSVHQVRRALGAALAREVPAVADMVMPVPDTATSAAAGYAEASGIPFGEGLMKNRYVGRTFIQPTQTIRQLGIKLKLNPLRESVQGRRLVVVDDSIVRGNTTRAIVRTLREAGATEVHVRITSPPVRWPCFYGIDMPTRAELIASGMAVEEIAAYVGADSLGYLSLDALRETARPPGASRDRPGLCTACFTGRYPIPVDAAPERSAVPGPGGTGPAAVPAGTREAGAALQPVPGPAR
jgi:amidophosphoribosyltransferase